MQFPLGAVKNIREPGKSKEGLLESRLRWDCRSQLLIQQKRRGVEKLSDSEKR